jgi:hypothetical protein
MLTLQSRVRPIPAVLTVAGMVGLAYWLTAVSGHPERFVANLIRVAVFAGIAVAVVLPWGHRALEQLSSAWKARHVGDTAPPPPSGILIQRASGVRRSDLYVVACLVVLAIIWLSFSRRYTISHYMLGSYPAYQRTDTWRGTTEVYIVRNGSQKPTWVSFRSDPR